LSGSILEKTDAFRVVSVSSQNHNQTAKGNKRVQISCS